MNLILRPSRPHVPPPLVARALAMLMIPVLLLGPGLPRAQTSSAGDALPMSGGPVRLRQPSSSDLALPGGRPDAGLYQRDGSRDMRDFPRQTAVVPPAPERPSDFETYVRKQPGAGEIRRLGQDLIDGLQRGSEAGDYNPLVPPDYLLRAGDELVITIWGTVDADLRVQVDRSGRIQIPRVGPVMVSGVRYVDLADVISRRVAQVFKNFQLSVSLGQLRGVQVYVTGFVSKPGALLVNSLSTLAQAVVRAGGPSPAGSFRNIQLRRGRNVVAQLDLYSLLLKGDRTDDQILQADDVIHIGPIGPQVAIIGSVNRPAIFELKSGETIDDVLQMAGGFSAVADMRQLTLDRLSELLSNRLYTLDLPASGTRTLANGDILRATNAAELVSSTGMKRKRVRVEGEVAKPGEYVLPAESTLADALLAAGGTTANAYLYATEFARESVRVTQQQNYDRALRDYEMQLTTAASTRRAATSEEAAISSSSLTASNRVIEQLRTTRPTGRVVLQLTPTSQSLPDLVLEDGDRLKIPSRPNTVGVFGSVYSSGNYLHATGRTVGDYLRLAGGPSRGADDSGVFVIRANGSVNSSLQEGGFFSRGNRIAGLATEPGDTIFVPEEMNKTTWVQNAKDWTQILYQLGIGLAGMKSAVQ